MRIMPDELCPHCGMKYGDFRTGLDFVTVQMMLWSGSDDRSTWRHKSRGVVLGLWMQLKQDMWRHHMRECEPDDDIPW